jgi:hypothetical protein
MLAGVAAMVTKQQNFFILVMLTWSKDTFTQMLQLKGSLTWEAEDGNIMAVGNFHCGSGCQSVLRDHFPGDPWIHFCSGYFEV